VRGPRIQYSAEGVPIDRDPDPVRMGWLLSLWDRWVPRITLGYSRPLPVSRSLFPTAVDGPQIASAAVPAKDYSGIPAFRSVVNSLAAVSAGGADINRFSRGSGPLTLVPCNVLSDGVIRYIPRARSDAFSVSIYPRLVRPPRLRATTRWVSSVNVRKSWGRLNIWYSG